MSPEQSADLEMQELAEKAENFKHGMVHISREKKAMLGNPWLYGSKSGNAACLAAKRVVNRPSFERAVIWCVVANTLVLMMDYMGVENVCYTTGPAAGRCITQAA